MTMTFLNGMDCNMDKETKEKLEEFDKRAKSEVSPYSSLWEVTGMY